MGAVAEKGADVGDNKDEAGEGPTRIAGARPRLLLVAITAMPETPAEALLVSDCHRCSKRGYWKGDCTAKLCSRCQGRGHKCRCLPHVRVESMQPMQWTGARC